MNLKPLPLLLLAPALAMAQAAPSAVTVSALDELQVSQKTWGMYTTLGLNGWGVGVVHGWSDKWSLRADISTYNRSQSLSQDGTNYNLDLSLGTVGVYADYRPFSGVFRGTVGALLKSPSAQMLATPSTNQKITINNVEYTTTNDQLTGKLEFPSVMPYVGLGWGWGKPLEKGFKFVLDLGLAIGSPKATLSGTGTVLGTAQAQADIAAQQQKINDDASKLPGLPVVKIGLGYVF